MSSCSVPTTDLPKPRPCSRAAGDFTTPGPPPAGRRSGSPVNDPHLPMTRPKRIGVLTSGGDCPGLNAVIRGVVRAAANLDWKVFGFVDGFEGLLPPGDFIPLTVARTAGIMQLGGTMIGTTNRGHFVAKVGEGQKAEIPKEIVEQAKDTLRRLQIDAVIAIGGDGSLTTAQQLY